MNRDDLIPAMLIAAALTLCAGGGWLIHDCSVRDHKVEMACLREHGEIIEMRSGHWCSFRGGR